MSTLNGPNLLLQCTFHDVKFTGCVALVHPATVHDSSQNGLMDIRVYTALTQGSVALLNITLENVGDRVVVFAYDSEMGIMDDNPLYEFPGSMVLLLLNLEMLLKCVMLFCIQL